MDISSLLYVSAPEIKEFAAGTATAPKEKDNSFDTILDQAMASINQTNGYFKDAQDMELKLSLGQIDNTHDVTTALAKAESALQYTIAVRDKLMDAYKEIMQIQI